MVQKQLQVSGGLCRSVFPRLNEWLDSDSDHLEILRELATEATLEYRSIADLIFCETFRDHQEACQAFYEGRGKPLRELYGQKELAMFERGLLFACHTAYKQFKANRFRSWASIAGLVALEEER